mmetsp:Transcript_21639/g.38206  ORF Transcript_21639/g.38206 Transcript_21639/m.38206 type:complete len:275 (+) Transcript_21639:257-1081(+)
MSGALLLFSSLQPWQVGNIFAYGLNAGITGLSMPSKGGEPPLSKIVGHVDDNKVVSDAYPVLVTPAGYAFSIWGPIFILELGFTIVQAFTASDPGFALAAPYWSAACVGQAIWAIAFGKRYTGIAAGLLTGIMLCLNQVHAITSPLALSYPILTKLPFAMHFSWAVAAAAINWNVFLKQSKASSQVLNAAAWISIAVTTAVTAVTAIQRQDPTVAFVATWALRAIASKEKDPGALDCTPDTIRQINKICSILSMLSAGLGLAIVGMNFSGTQIY